MDQRQKVRLMAPPPPSLNQIFIVGGHTSSAHTHPNIHLILMAVTKSKTVKQVVAKAVEPMATPKRKSSPLFKLIGLVVGGIVAIAVLFLIVIITGSLTMRWHSPVVTETAKLVHYPVVSVNGHWRSYADYLDVVGA